MKRIKGHIDLEYILNMTIDLPDRYTKESEEKLFKDLYDQLNSRSNITIIKCDFNNSLVFNFEYEGEIYYFKYDRQAIPENELFAHYAAYFLGMPSVEYDLAYLGPFRGVISKNFKRKDAIYTLGIDVLADAELDYIKDPNLKREEMRFQCLNKNSLKCIKEAFESRFKNRKDREELIDHLMKQLINMFFFDIILTNPDRGQYNWSLVEYSDGTVDIAPLFDNARIFAAPPEQTNMEMSISKETFKDISLKEVLEEFKNFFPKEIIEDFINKLWILKEASIEDILKKIKNQIKQSLPPHIKEHFYECCRETLDFLMKALGLESLPVSRFVDFTTIQELQNDKDLEDGRISITVISPSETFHAIPITPCFCLHNKLFEDVYQKIYDAEIDKISPYTIRIHHVVRNSKDKDAYIFVPKYITEYEFHCLAAILEALEKDNTGIIATIDTFDPINQNFHGKEVQFFDDEILDYIKEANLIIDYDIPFEANKNIQLESTQKSIT